MFILGQGQILVSINISCYTESQACITSLIYDVKKALKFLSISLSRRKRKVCFENWETKGLEKLICFKWKFSRKCSVKLFFAVCVWERENNQLVGTKAKSLSPLSLWQTHTFSFSLAHTYTPSLYLTHTLFFKHTLSLKHTLSFSL